MRHQGRVIMSAPSDPPPSAADRDSESARTAGSAGASFESVYEAHFDFVWRSLRRLGVPAPSLEDAVQDLFIVVCRRLGEFQGRASVKTWLFSIAIRVAKEHTRRQARQRLDALSQAPQGPRLPSEHAAEAEAVALLDQLLAEMDEDKRAVFVMAELEEMSAPEIAEALRMNPNTVYTRLRAARRCLNEALRRHRAEQPSSDASEVQGGCHE